MQKSIFSDMEESEVKKFTMGVDFIGSIDGFRNNARSFAKNHGMKCESMKISDTEVLIEFHPPFRGAMLYSSRLAQRLN